MELTPTYISSLLICTSFIGLLSIIVYQQVNGSPDCDKDTLNDTDTIYDRYEEQGPLILPNEDILVGEGYETENQKIIVRNHNIFQDEDIKSEYRSLLDQYYPERLFNELDEVSN